MAARGEESLCIGASRGVCSNFGRPRRNSEGTRKVRTWMYLSTNFVTKRYWRLICPLISLKQLNWFGAVTGVWSDTKHLKLWYYFEFKFSGIPFVWYKSNDFGPVDNVCVVCFSATREKFPQPEVIIDFTIISINRFTHLLSQGALWIIIEGLSDWRGRGVSIHFQWKFLIIMFHPSLAFQFWKQIHNIVSAAKHFTLTIKNKVIQSDKITASDVTCFTQCYNNVSFSCFCE